MSTNIILTLTSGEKRAARHCLPTTGLLILAITAGTSNLPSSAASVPTGTARIQIVERLASIAKHLSVHNTSSTIMPSAPPGTGSNVGANPVIISRTPDEQKQWMQRKVSDNEAVSHGEQQVQSGDLNNAIATFQTALNSPTADQNAALRGLAHCAAAVGDIKDEVSFLRPTIYSNDSSVAGTVFGDGYRENNVQRLMEFAIALDQTGQSKEAALVYNRTIGLFNYDGVQPRHKVMLPPLGNASGQEAYTSQKLEANAHLAISVNMFEFIGYGSPEPLAHLQQALSLAPDSAAANYYMGHYLYGKSAPGAKAFLKKAMQLGGSETSAAAKEMIPLAR